jgi:hypothetical protein
LLRGADEKPSSGLALKPTDLSALLTEQIAHLRPFPTTSRARLTALTSMAISKSRLRAELGVCCNFATASKLFSSEHDLKLFYCRPNVGSAQLFNMGDNHAQVIPNGRSTVGASGNLDDRECR